MTTRATRAGSYEGKPVWHGLYQIDGQWRTAKNSDDKPLAYTSEETALAGAKLFASTAWKVAKYPGDSVRMRMFQFGEPVKGQWFDIGDVRIMDYGKDSKTRYRVACFLPGRDVCVEGDTPKTEANCDNWCNTEREANRWFDLYVNRAIRDGWKDYVRQ
jgi:hypothetical protein